MGEEKKKVNVLSRKEWILLHLIQTPCLLQFVLSTKFHAQGKDK